MTSAFDENWMLPRFDRTPSRPPAAPSTPGRAGKAAAAGAASVADVEATQEAMAAGNTSAVEASLHASGASPLRTSPRALDPLLAEWVDYVRTCESHGEAAAAGDATLRRRTCNPEPGTVSSLLDAWAAALRNEASPAATPATAMVNAASSSAPPSGRRRILEAAMAEAAAETAAEAAAKAAAEAAATAAAATTTTATSSTAAGTSRLAPRSVASPPSGEARAKPRPSMGTRAREAAAKTFKHLLWPLSPSRPARASSPASPGRSPVGRPAARPALRPLPTPSDDDAPPMLMMAPMGALSTARSPAPPSAQSRRRPVASPRADAVPSTWAEAGEPLATAAARQEDVNVKALSTADTVTVASATLSGAAGRPPVVSPPATPPLRRQLTAETVHSLAEESRAPRRPLSPASQESSDSSNSSEHIEALIEAGRAVESFRTGAPIEAGRAMEFPICVPGSGCKALERRWSHSP